MDQTTINTINRGRLAVRSGDWITVSDCANQLKKLDKKNPEGYFQAGLVERAKKNPATARKEFRKALELDPQRYDAAIELANQYAIARRDADALATLEKYVPMLDNSPVYLDLAGSIYTDIGLPQKGYPLFKKATELQPGVDLFQANLASSAVYAGEIDEAERIYRSLLERFPKHKRNHYHLSRLRRARDDQHVRQMKDLIRKSNEAPEQNIFLYYALGKELEDLERWEESFDYYKKAGDAVTSVANYDIRHDIELIDRIIEICDEPWLKEDLDRIGSEPSDKTPIFIVGLPRTGTTLTERIISSHSQVQSLGETLFFQMVLRRESRIESTENMTVEMIEALSLIDTQDIAWGYEEAVAYRLGDEPFFIDKLPFNFMYLGFIAKAWPNAKIVHLARNPMDACFSMYKQVFTWAYKFSYSLDWLGQYYIAHDRLRRHWQSLLGDRMIDVRYENLVADPENQTRLLLDQLGLEFEEACLNFDKNQVPSTTASSVQVREKVHSGSVNRWKRFERQLQPLREQLEAAGIEIEPAGA
mgnify:CR=1 FL=1